MIKMKNPCEGCYHYHEGHCPYFDDPDRHNKTEEESFSEHCIGCCCGDGCECNLGQRCSNYETEEELIC